MNRAPSFLISLLMLAAVLVAGPGLAATPSDDERCDPPSDVEIASDCDGVEGAELAVVNND